MINLFHAVSYGNKEFFMKNVKIFLTILTTALILALPLTSCDNGGGSTGGNNGGNTTKLRVSNEPVTIVDTPTSNDFAYLGRDNPLSNGITGTPKVQIAGGKLTLELDAPKDAVLQLITDVFSAGFTVTPTDAKGVYIPYFNDSDEDYYLYMKGPGADGETLLFYVDKDVKINGTVRDEDRTDTFNASLKKGWNYLSIAVSGTTRTYTASQKKPSGAKWTVEK